MEDRDKIYIDADDLIFNTESSKIKAEGIDPKVWKHITANWNDDLFQDQVDTMYASLTDKRIISLMLSTFDKYSTLNKLDKMKTVVTEKDLYETKVDLSTPAIKRFAKYLDRETNEATYELQQTVLAEIKFLGAMSLSKNWQTFVVWHYVTDKDAIRELDETLNGDGSYISAIIYPNNNKEPRSVVYPTFKSKDEIDKLAQNGEEVFDHKMLGLTKTQKVVMMNFYQANGLASFFNDSEFATEMYQMKKKIDINTIQQRFAYVRQFLCGLSQNKLAFWLSEEGIQIDNKGVKYWEEKQTDEPSFVKNHWKEVKKVLSEHSFHLLRIYMSNDLYRYSQNGDWRAVDIKQVEWFLNDFILYGTPDAIRFEIPEMIKHTTELKIKSEKDLLWENATLKKISSNTKARPLTEKEVMDESGYLKQWINLFLGMDESKILDDLDAHYDDEYTKKEVYYLWHKANEIYQVDPVSTKLDKKTKKGQKNPPF